MELELYQGHALDRLALDVLDPGDVATELKGNSHVGKVDIQQYQSLANKFKVRNIPTMILLKNGAEVNRFVGIKSKEFLLKEIAKVS